MITMSGITFVHDGPLDSVGVLTVELRSKWYGLWHITETTGRAIYFHELDRLYTEQDLPGPPFVDHVPNPYYVVALGKKLGIPVSDLALEMIVGRWELEVGDRYTDLLADL